MDIFNSCERFCFKPLIDDPKTLPQKSGLYIICANSLDTLPDELKEATFSYVDDHPIIYVGISKKQGLEKRDYKNHFKGSARNSTLRKSLGSLFNYERCYDKNNKYRFIKEHEIELTEWMHENLFFYYWLIDDNVEKIETNLMNQFGTPLNLKNNKSLTNKEFRCELSKLRNKK